MKDIAIGIQVVRVFMAEGVGDRPTVQFWVAAVPRDKAADAVQRVLPEGWTAKLHERRLAPKDVARLNLRPGEVREMTS